MKKVLICIIIVVIGSLGVYYGLTKVDDDSKPFSSSKKENSNTSTTTKEENEKPEVVPSRDAFVSEAIKLQTLAENQNSNDTCKCYNVKELDKNTSLTGSILVYTIDDLFVTSMWLSNGYYILNQSDSVATGQLEESSEQASIYCGEESASQQSSLCASNY